MTKEVRHKDLVEMVVRRLLSEVEEHGGIVDFCEKLNGFPEQYITELALGAIDCVSLSGCLNSRVVYN